MSTIFTLPVPGTLGTNGGVASDGVLVGQLTSTPVTKALLQGKAASVLCFTYDGGTYVNEDTDINEATGDDVDALPAVPATGDAIYFGNATAKFESIDIKITTQGAGTWTITWEYWNGSAWTALNNVTDGTTGFTAAAATVNVSYDVETDWAKCTVDSVLAYWVRARVSAYTSVTTQPLLGQAWLILETAAFTDDTTDFNDAGAGDVDLLPAHPVEDDAFYIVHTEKFCKLKITTSQARTGTATLTWEYWNGTAWTAITTAKDDSIGWSATAGAHLIHFVPPANWTACTAANGPNGEAGFAVRCRLSSLTSVTQQPLATIGYVLPLVTGAEGQECVDTVTATKVTAYAQTNSATNSDSVFLLLNVTSGAFATFTWGKGDPNVEQAISLAIAAGDEVAVVQVQEDGTTEFADATFRIVG